MIISQFVTYNLILFNATAIVVKKSKNGFSAKIQLVLAAFV